MENPAKETIIIVHGTWAAPKDDQQPDQLCWYQIPAEGQREPNFVSKLDKALEKRGSPARCWAHCKNNSEIFSWSGENAWIDRTLAGSSLAAKINKLQADGWRCHVVAHSHGGNVVVEALPQIEPLLNKPSGLSGTITTLGTPFIDTMSPITERIRRQRWRQLYLFTGFLLFTTIVILGHYYENYESWRHFREVYPLFFYGGLVFMFYYVVILIGLLKVSFSKTIPDETAFRRFIPMFGTDIGLYGIMKGLKRVGRWSEYWNAVENAIVPRLSMLSISSPMDEAWQVLHHMREIPNPLAPEFSLFGFMLRNRREYLERRCATDRIQGVAFFPTSLGPAIITTMFSILLLAVIAIFITNVIVYIKTLDTFYAIIPITFGIVIGVLFIAASINDNNPSSCLLRWITRQFQATGRIFYDVGTYMARLRSWSLLQEIAFGLEGYGLELPDATRVPTFAPPALYKYEELPTEAQQRALAKREKWVQQAFGDVAKTLSQMAAIDLKSLLKMVETDLSLVHAAYYTDDECIERIADWIAGKARSIKAESGSPDTVRLAS